MKLSKQAEEYLPALQKEFMPEDSKPGMIQNWLDRRTEGYVCVQMIYEEVFGHTGQQPKAWEAKEIGQIMNTSIVGWEKVSSHRFGERYGIQRGWKRVADPDGFTKAPEQMEIPFAE